MGDDCAEWTLVVPGPVPLALACRSERVEARENLTLAWRSTPDSRTDVTAPLDLRPALEDRGTELHASLEYRPRSMFAAWPLPSLWRTLFAQAMASELSRIRSLLEAGQVATVASQPAAHAAFAQPERRGLSSRAVRKVLRRSVL